MKIEDLYANDYYKSLASIDKLSSSRIANKDLKTQTKLFSIVTSSTNLISNLKKSNIENKEAIVATLSKIGNTVNGILSSDNLTREEAKLHIKKLKRRAGVISGLVEAQLKTLYKDKVSAITFEDLSKLTANIEEDDKQEIEKILDANISVIKGLQNHADKLPTQKDESKKFIMASLPIVAISPLSKDDFIKGGFSVSPLGMYSVLNDQLIIGINPDNIDGMSLEKYLSMVVKGLSNRTGLHYIVMTHPKPYRNSGLIYYWIVEEKTVNRLRSHTGKNFQINKWGFAFK